MRRTLVALALSCAVAASGSAQQPARDAPVVPTKGTGTVAGIVVNDETPAQPVRRAIVTLAGPELKPSRGAITDDNGRFRITNLPAGRFTLTVVRAAFITSAFGAKRPGRPGTPITLANGGTADGLVVRLWRGAVVAGVVRDERGVPVPRIPVTAIPAREINTGAMLTLSNNGVVTNELGEYRIFGLEPGTYAISARPSSGSGGPLTSMTDSQVDAALDALARRAAGGTPAAARPSAPTVDAPRPFAYAPVYHPSAADVEQAAAIVLKVGEERTGVDITLLRVATASVSGVVTRPDGSPAPGATVQLTRVVRPGPFNIGPPSRIASTADPSGAFRVPQVPPGDYRLIARVSIQPPAPPTPGVFTPAPLGDAAYWATADVSVAANDVSGIALTAAPGLNLSGRIEFASSLTPSTPSPDVRGMRVTLVAPWILNLKPNTPLEGLGSFAGASVQPDGTFGFTGLLASTYVLQVFGSSVAAPWWPRAAKLGDRDLFDSPTEITREMAAAPLVITYSDRSAELSGTLQTASGAAVSDVFVIAYSPDRRFWVQGSRRVRAVRPGVDGRYIFSDLPPGEYLLGAVTDVDQDEWLEAGFLDRLVPASVKLTIGEGEKRTQDLRIGG